MSAPSPPAVPAAAFLALGLAQIIGHGSLYYAFTVLTGAIATDLGWPASSVYACLSATLLAGGVLGPLTGRLLDRYGARRVMTAGAGIAGLGMAALSQASDAAGLVGALLVMQAGSALSLYEAIFTAFVQIDAARARPLITRITLFGGLSSTVFWPLTQQLQIWIDWRHVYLVFAALQILVVLPIYWLALGRAGGSSGPAPRPARAAPTVAVKPHGGPPVRSALALVAAGFALASFGYNAVNLVLVDAMTHLGVDAGTVAWLGALMGPSTIAGRLGEAVFGARLHPLATARLTAALLVVSALLVVLLPPHLPILAAFMVLFGLSNGLTSIVRGTLPLALFGPRGYGERVGAINAVRVVAAAAAPLLFALGLEAGGALAAFGAVAGLAALALACFLCIPMP